MQKSEETTEEIPDTAMNRNVFEKKEQEEQETQTEQPRLSEMEDAQAKYILDFAKANYKKIMSPTGNQIKINGKFYSISKITETTEDEFTRLETALNLANPLKPKETREALYNFLTFATSVTKADLKEADRGELKNIALILGMMQKGFRNI